MAKESADTGKAAEKVGDGFTKGGKITKKKLEEIAKKAGKTTSEVREEAEKLAYGYEQAGMDASEAMQKAYAEIEQGAEKVSESGDGFGTRMKSAFGKVGKAAGIVAGAVTAIWAGMSALESETREYRAEMGKLDAAFTTSGHTTEAARKTYQSLQSVLGETDQSVEAANHLAKLCTTEEELQSWTDTCTGVYATFGDSLPIESLTEAANETAKTGEVTGALADALNWAGIDEEAFNEKLAACNTERERAQLITDTLNGLYKDAADIYKKNNKAVIDANAAQEKWNEATARIAALIAPAVNSIKNGLANALLSVVDAYEALGEKTRNADSHLWENAKTSEEAAAVMKDLERQIADVKAVLDSGWGSEMDYAEYDRLRNALSGATEYYYALVEAEQAAAAEAGNAIAAAATSAETASAEYSKSATSILDRFKETYTQIAGQVGGWFGPFERASASVSANIYSMKSAMQSQIDFNNNYATSLQKLGEYGLGSLADSFQSLGPDGAAYADAIVKAVERAGGASSERGQEIIQQFSDLDSQVQTSQENVTEQLTLLSGEFETELGAITQMLTDEVAEWDQAEEAYTAAENTINKYLEGVGDTTPGLETAMAALGTVITSTIQANIDPVTVPVVMATVDGVTVESGPNVDGSHASGLDYVPFDGYLAQLHKGESVLTAREAAAWRAGETKGSNAPATPQEIITNITLELDGAVLARQLFRHNQTVTNDRGLSFVRG